MTYYHADDILSTVRAGTRRKAPTFVEYMLSSGRNKGQVRTAVVVHDCGEGRLNLIVFTDCANDFEPHQQGFNGTLWATSVPYSELYEPHTWHQIKER